MVCMRIPGGFVCGPVPRNRRCACGAESTLLCDHPATKAKTCDRGLCERCAYHMPAEKHLCRQHYAEGRAAGRIPPRVWHKNDPRTPADAVYIGRPSKWGNPFSHKPDTQARYQVATRGVAIAQYSIWLKKLLAKHPDGRARLQAELRGKDLACWCAPQACHGDVLIEIANAPLEVAPCP